MSTDTRTDRLRALAERFCVELNLGPGPDTVAYLGGTSAAMRQLGAAWAVVEPSIREGTASEGLQHWCRYGQGAHDGMPWAFWEWTAPGLTADELDEIRGASGVKS